MKDDFQQPKQWASGTGIAQASEGSTAIVYNGPSVSELMQAISAAVFPGVPGLNHLLVTVPRLVSSAPVAPSLPLPRKTLVLQLTQALERDHSAVLKGDVGSGRSELARSYAENLPQVFWLDLETNAQLPPSLAMEMFLQSVSGISPSEGTSASRWASIPKSAVLVIENISQAVNDPGFAARVGEVVSNAKANEYFVILSAIHPLPNPLKRLVPEVEVDRFSDEEVRELLSLHGAPDAIVKSGMNNLVWGLTHGMPDLVDALLRSLSRRNWRLDSGALDDLLHSNYSSDLRSNTQRLLRATETEAARELLYRLTLLNRASSEVEAIEIAQVEPAVAKPLELFEELKGSWLQHAYRDHWRTSPLLSGMGEANLDPSVRYAVHSLAAHWILKDGAINQYSAADAITHLNQADRYNEAANVLIQSLQGLMEAPVDADAGLLLALWADMPLPTKIGYGLRLFIRALQVTNAHRRKQDYRYPLADLTTLLASAREPIEHISAFAACSLVAYRLVDEEPILCLPYISLAAGHEQYVPAKLHNELGGHSPVEIFWAAAMKIDGSEGVERWLDEVSHLPAEQLQKMMVTEFAADAAAFLFDRLWMREQQNEEGERDWHALLQFLEKCGQKAAKWNNPLILACTLRSRQAIRIVHTGDIDQALTDAEKFYSSHDGSGTAAFLVAAGTAAWLIDAERWDLAGVWLTRAYTFQGSRLALYRFQNAIRYGELLFREGAPNVLPFEFAVSLSVEHEDLTDLAYLQARGELATFYYKNRQIEALYREWSTIVREALKNRHKSRRWKHFFMLIANHTAYFSDASGLSAPPSKLVTEPALGMFIGDLRDLSDRYSEGIVFLQAGAMAQFADWRGHAKEAYDWALEAAKLGAVVSNNTSAEHFLTHAIPFDIQEKRYTLALEHAIRAARGFASRQPLALSPEVEAERQQESSFDLASIGDHFSRFAPINLGLIPVLIDIASWNEENAESSREALLSVLDICRSQHDAADDPLIWEIAIDALEQVLKRTISISNAGERNPALSTSHADEQQILWTYGAVMMDDATPRELWLAQGKLARWISGFYGHLGNLGMTVCNSIARIWLARIARNGYLFRLPQYAIKKIEEAAAESHLGKILLAVAESLDLNLSDEYREVLSSCTMTRLR